MVFSFFIDTTIMSSFKLLNFITVGWGFSSPLQKQKQNNTKQNKNKNKAVVWHLLEGRDCHHYGVRFSSYLLQWYLKSHKLHPLFKLSLSLQWDGFLSPSPCNHYRPILRFLVVESCSFLCKSGLILS